MIAAEGGYEIDDNPDRVDEEALWQFLATEAYWSRWRSRADLVEQLRSAWRVVGCYASDGAMVGFSRAVSDGVAIAYLADVYVLAEHRGRGLATALLAEMIDNGPGRDLLWLLHTRDAHGLYRRFGFAEPDERYLERPGRRR